MSDHTLSWREYCERMGYRYQPPEHDPSPLVLFTRHPLKFIDLNLHDLATVLRGKGWIRLLSVLERVGIIVAVVLFGFELHDRKAERHNRAWTIIASARGTHGNIGLNSALQTLHQDGISLANVNLEGSWLEDVQLQYANLYDAQLGKAKLRGAELNGADMRKAGLVEARLVQANLTKADLTGADLTGAVVSQDQLGAACADPARPLKLSPGLTPPRRTCPPG